MPHAHAHAPAPLTDSDLERIEAGCGHARVPGQPARRGYRYVDIGGHEPPFYYRRLTAGRLTGAVLLQAPIEESSGDDAERGAPALARVAVTIGASSVPWRLLADVELCRGAYAELMRQALAEVADLDLIDARSCPFCG
jgi:hypothetical protein